MRLTNISLKRAISHEVFGATRDEKLPPDLKNNLVEIDESGKKLVEKRLVDNLSTGSQCVAVTVTKSGKDSTFDYATKMLDASDDEFIWYSRDLTVNLSDAQQRFSSIRSGLVLFFEGTCAVDNQPSRFIAIVKAESDKGLSAITVNGKVTLTLIADVVLGGQQRFYKIGFFAETSPPPKPNRSLRQTSAFTVRVFDHLIGVEKPAARYFYETFLGCSIPADSATTTKAFFEASKSAFCKMEVSDDDRVRYHIHLVSYLMNNDARIDPRRFATDYLYRRHQDEYCQELEACSVADTFHKDTSLIAHKLKRGAICFSSKVSIQGSTDALVKYVKVGKSVEGWTEVRIHGFMESAW